jgi:hypothetical protein
MCVGDLVISEKGKTANQVHGNSKENATILFCADATGKIVTKTILLPYERMPSPVAKVIPQDWSLGKTKTGWMTSKAFYEYMGMLYFPSYFLSFFLFKRVLKCRSISDFS